MKQNKTNDTGQNRAAVFNRTRTAQNPTWRYDET